MSDASMTAVDGDPAAVATAAHRLSSIADQVAAAAKTLRALAGVDSTWSGGASQRAQHRSATLPPKLAKATVSYAAAGQSLGAYATALAGAQGASRAALSLASRAEVELAAARSAQAAAQEADARAAAAARSAGQPAPPATAARYAGTISAAAAQLAHARAANAAAHDAQRHAATRAAAALHDANRAGIHNASWWSHVTTAAMHWAKAQWVEGVRLLAKVATAVSTVAGLAALTLAAAGIAFPPLEAAAAVLETVSLVSAAVGVAADATLAATGHGSWRAAGLAAIALAPAGLAKAISAVARLSRVARVADEAGVAPAMAGPPPVAGGASDFTEPGDLFGEYARRTAPLPGYHDVVVHGSETDFGGTPDAWARGDNFDHRLLAHWIKNDSSYPGGPVRLISCETGRLPDGAAQRLADSLHVDVLAPDDTIWAYPDGSLTIGPDDGTTPGAWVTFRPGDAT